jgi:hypothetical protein
VGDVLPRGTHQRLGLAAGQLAHGPIDPEVLAVRRDDRHGDDRPLERLPERVGVIDPGGEPGRDGIAGGLGRIVVRLERGGRAIG